ncbi:hypothetical protein I4U23_002475 [Adineta vaga]|nr:hypothetical protein I4U23_002475 [Adineta vaga]
MQKLNIALVFFITILSKINGNPFLFFPKHMLPSLDTSFNFTFNGHMTTMTVSGIYTVEPVTDQDMKTIIGYRNWQSYTGEYTGIFYGVSYFNGTYLQALIDPNTQECTNVFSEVLDCTDWLNTAIVKWDSRCSIIRTDPPITGEMILALRASTSDLTRPSNFSGTVTITGSPDKSTITYDFLSKTVQKNFPYVKCYF